MRFFKFVGFDYLSYGYRFTPGLNITDKQLTSIDNKYPKDGLCFADENNIFCYLGYGEILFDVTLPPDAGEEQFGQEWRANRIILGNQYRRDDVNTIRYLLSCGADVSVSNNYALKWAVKNNNLEMVKELIEAGADKNVLKIENNKDGYIDNRQRVDNEEIKNYIRSVKYYDNNYFKMILPTIIKMRRMKYKVYIFFLRIFGYF